MSELESKIKQYKKIIREHKKENILLRNRVRTLEKAMQNFKDSISEYYTK